MIRRGSRLLGPVLVVVLGSVLSVPVAGAQEPAPEPVAEPTGEPLVVAVREIPPFAMEHDGRWSGYSVDMWEAAADALDVDFENRQVTAVGDQLAAVQDGTADAALGAISITAEREAVVDFTQPLVESGVGIMVAREGRTQGVGRALAAMFTRTLLVLLAGIAVLVVIVGHVVWLVERRRNSEDFPHEYWPGVLEGMWWSVVTMTTVGYGDRVARTTTGRVVAVVWMVVGLVLVAQLTAVVTSTLTVQRLEGTIAGVGDLFGRTVATVEGTTSADYLASIDLTARELPDIDDAVDELLAGRVEAVVFDEPVLRYQAATVGADRLEVVPVLYQPQGIGMAFPQGSPLVEPVSSEFLEQQENGTAATLEERYFGTP